MEIIDDTGSFERMQGDRVDYMRFATTIAAWVAVRCGARKEKYERKHCREGALLQRFARTVPKRVPFPQMQPRAAPR